MDLGTALSQEDEIPAPKDRKGKGKAKAKGAKAGAAREPDAVGKKGKAKTGGEQNAEEGAGKRGGVADDDFFAMDEDGEEDEDSEMDED